MSTICEVKFVDRENGVFLPGEIVRCKVVLKITKPKTVQEIRSLVTGKTKVRWKTGSKNSTTHTNECIYFASKTILQKDPQADTFELSIGTYSYDFELQLPNNLASSYHGEFGQTYYEVKVTLAREWRFDNEFVQPFTVIYPVDLNQNPQFKRPTCETEEKISHIICCWPDPQGLKIKLETPLSGYVPGQSIPINLVVSNSSSLNCDQIIVKLHRHALFLAIHPYETTNYASATLLRSELPGVPSSSNKNFETTFLVPPTPPSSPPMFDIIKIWYTISVEGILGCFHSNLKMFVPITIGTIPLPESIENATAGTSSSSNEARAPLLRHMSSFEESESEQKSFVDHDRDSFIKYQPFKPKYPTFGQGETSRT